MRAAWLGILVLGGCDYVLHLDTVTARDGGTGSGGDAHVADAALPVTYIAPGDIDNDGELNGVDPCPLLAHEDPTDDDHDGLPNVCDPDLNTATGGKDCIVLLDGFYGHPLDPRWKSDIAWAQGGGTGAEGLYSPATVSHAYFYFDAHVDAARVEADIRIVGGAGTPLDNFSVSGAMQPGNGDVTGRACVITRTATASAQANVADLPAPLIYASSTKSSTQGYAQNAEFYPQWTMGPAQDQCSLVENETGIDATHGPSTTSDRIGLRVATTNVAVFYLVAYGRSCQN